MHNQTKINFLREPQVLEITRLSKSTRWRLERDGKFPNRRRLSANTVGWLASEVDQWLKSRTIVSEEGK